LQIEIIDETPPGGGEPWKLQTEPARQLVNLADISVVVVTAEASYHAAYDECTVRFLKQAGVMVSWLRLADQGIRGNGHMMFMEKNNLSIAHLLEKHIAMLLLKNPPPSKPTNPPHTSSSTPPKIPADLTPPRDT